MNYLALFFCFATSLTCFAQAKLEGTVRDAETGEPIVFGTVALFQNGVIVTVTETDFDGYYSITEIDEGVYDVKFSTTGYKESKVEKFWVAGRKANKLDVGMDIGEIQICWFFCDHLPLVVQDNTTQGMIFNMDAIRNLPFR